MYLLSHQFILNRNIKYLLKGILIYEITFIENIYGVLTITALHVTLAESNEIHQDFFFPKYISM